MDDLQKTNVLQKAKQHVEQVSIKIFETKMRIDNSVVQLRKELIKARGDDRDTKEILLYHHLDTQRNMEQQHASPYFIRCDVKFDDEQTQETLYFGRFPYTAESIYSWITPAAVVRFDSPGRFSYQKPNGEKRNGLLLRKDQFMIVDAKIIFMSTESTEIARELIYQEYFSQRKSEFALKEIVAQMEEAQDTIIRSHYFGSFLISGPAGSGKTTLALHRAAYLIQSPDTAALFPSKQVLVFVHDVHTKHYFDQLLPQLGIHNVSITTFDAWALKILGLADVTYVQRYGRTEREKDEYEFERITALNELQPIKTETNIYKTLQTVYKKYLTENYQQTFAQQEQQKVLDRVDLTVLLKLSLLRNNYLEETIERYKKQTNGKYVKKVQQQPVQYALIILDEAENYLRDQIAIIKSCIDPKTNGMIYVGDLVQRTLPFTISDWEEVHEAFTKERKIILQKVYRNTKQILEYIQSLGYAVTIPNTSREGQAVTKQVCTKKDDEITQVTALVTSKKDSLIGILAKSEEYLEDYKKLFADQPNVHVLSINEAQGVEFETVILVGIDTKLFGTQRANVYLQTERQRVDRDLLYVAMTRAINDLYIFGKIPLKELLQNS